MKGVEVKTTMVVSIQIDNPLVVSGLKKLIGRSQWPLADEFGMTAQEGSALIDFLGMIPDEGVDS